MEVYISGGLHNIMLMKNNYIIFAYLNNLNNVVNIKNYGFLEIFYLAMYILPITAGKGNIIQVIILFYSMYRGVESSTISSVNFSILGSNKRFFDKLYVAIIT